MKNIIIKTFCLLFATAVVSLSVSYPRGYHMSWATYSTAMLTYIQDADLAGLATIVSANKSNWTIEVDVKQWWLGSLSSNRFDIGNADLHFDPTSPVPGPFMDYEWNPLENIGRDIVFYVVTNEWKFNSSPSPDPMWFDWNWAQTYTGALYECPPVFMPPTHPPVFLVDTNSNHYLHALSNMTESIFISRDKWQFYRAMRDIWGLDRNPPHPYKAMVRWPFIYILRELSTEPDLVELLNDPLLDLHNRTNALNRLIRDFNWSPTNTVPFP